MDRDPFLKKITLCTFENTCDRKVKEKFEMKIFF